MPECEKCGKQYSMWTTSIGSRLCRECSTTGSDTLQNGDASQPKAGHPIVTTGDLNRDYEIIGPVYFQVSNKGVFSSQLSKLIKQYDSEIAQMKKQGQLGEQQRDWGALYGEYSVGQGDFDKAFFIAVQELRKRAAALKADAVICMRQDTDLDTNGFAFFYMQIYGTAVRFK
jgi:hypothetical protein